MVKCLFTRSFGCCEQETDCQHQLPNVESWFNIEQHVTKTIAFLWNRFEFLRYIIFILLSSVSGVSFCFEHVLVRQMPCSTARILGLTAMKSAKIVNLKMTQFSWYHVIFIGWSDNKKEPQLDWLFYIEIINDIQHHVIEIWHHLKNSKKWEKIFRNNFGLIWAELSRDFDHFFIFWPILSRIFFNFQWKNFGKKFFSNFFYMGIFLFLCTDIIGSV